MKELQINADSFQSSENFVDAVCETVNEADGNLVPIYRDGKLFAYAVSPTSPLWEKLFLRN